MLLQLDPMFFALVPVYLLLCSIQIFLNQDIETYVSMYLLLCSMQILLNQDIETYVSIYLLLCSMQIIQHYLTLNN